MLFRRAAKTFFEFFFLNWFYVCFMPLFSGVLLNVVRYSKKNGNSVVFGFVFSSEVKN